MTYCRLDFETKPICARCSDMLFIRNADGEIVPCDCCCCPNCGRPRYRHADLNGCACRSRDTADGYVGQRRLIVGRGPIVHLSAKE